jgi:prepilin-type N-terminal cleavage/methylation domain-containing protein
MLDWAIMLPPAAFSPPQRRPGVPFRGRPLAAGFTLIEVMIVVAIIGILSALGIAAIRARALESNVPAAIVVVKTIAAAQEQYRALNQVYYDVPNGSQWYPDPPAQNTKRAFYMAARGAGDARSDDWYRLGPDVRQPVEFSFRADAGDPGADPGTDLATALITLPAVSPNEPWYLIQARADADGDSVFCYVAAASWSPEVVSVDDGE